MGHKRRYNAVEESLEFDLRAFVQDLIHEHPSSMHVDITLL